MEINKVVFLGSPEFCLPTLEALHKYFGSRLVGVFSQSDKPRGRGQYISFTPVKLWASEKYIPVFQPGSKEEFSYEIRTIKPDLIYVVAYGMILPKDITDNFLCINSHASLLPDYRGASPMQAALLNGDKKTGITLFKITEKMDSGDICAKQSIPIGEEDNIQSIHDKLSQLSAEMSAKFFHDLESDKVNFELQDHDKATYCTKIQKSDYQLNLNDDPTVNYNKVKAYSPVPGAYVEVEEKRVIILDVDLVDGQLIVNRLKPAGKPAMSYSDYCLGHPEGIEGLR